MTTYRVKYRKIWIDSWGVVQSETLEMDCSSKLSLEAITANYKQADLLVIKMPLQETINVTKISGE